MAEIPQGFRRDFAGDSVHALYEPTAATAALPSDGSQELGAAQGITTDVDHGIVTYEPTVERAMTAAKALEGILARYGAAVSATSTQARVTSPAAQFQDAVTRYADAVALATPQLRTPHRRPCLPGHGPHHPEKAAQRGSVH